MTSEREFDIIVFGATGYTGEYVVEELAKCVKLGNDKKWAIAGRSRQKLKASLEKVQQYLDEDTVISDIPIVEADISDKDSILDMCKRAKLILNCVGPYKLYGEIVVAACLDAGTHHVDISGEPKFLETMQLQYFHAAKERGVYIVQACGFDSIPSDYGISLLKKKFQGDLNSVDIYVKAVTGPQGHVINSGTWMSAVHSIIDSIFQFGVISDIKKHVFPMGLPYSKFRLPFRIPPVFYNSDVQSYCATFPGPDIRVIERSQMFCYEHMKEKPVHVQQSFQFASVWNVFSLVFFVVPLMLSLFPLGRTLLEKYPSFFSMGLFKKGGPKRSQVMGTRTEISLFGEGWSSKLPGSTFQHNEAPDKRMLLKVNGPEAAYALTSICMVNAGLTILDEVDKLPLSGGVLTPGAAFWNTSLQQRLDARGVKFLFSDAE